MMGLLAMATIVLSIVLIDRLVSFTPMLERLLLYSERYPLDMLSHFSSGLPIAMGLLRYKKLNRSGKFIWLLFIFYFVKDTYALIYSLIVPNNLYVQNIEQIICTFLVGSIYYYSFEKPLQKKLILSFTILCGLITIFAYDSLQVSTVSLSVFRMFSITLALLYFNKMIKDMQVKIITRHTLFWFTSALLLYSAGTFFIMLFSEYWNKDANRVATNTFDLYYNISLVLNIIFCCISAYGLLVSKYEQENLI